MLTLFNHTVFTDEDKRIIRLYNERRVIVKKPFIYEN